MFGRNRMLDLQTKRATTDRRIAFTVAEVAMLLGKHTNTVYGWVRQGVLPSTRLGASIYIPRSALAPLLETGKEGDT
jgi:excisionase family DNA binding protein